MDKKRTQRILGILVIIALVIILFPLLFGKSDEPTQTTTVAAPLFPDQQQATPAPAVANTNDINNDTNNSISNEQRASRTEVNAAPSTDEPAATPAPANHPNTTATPSPISDTQGENSAEVSPAIALELNNRATPDVAVLKTATQDDIVSIDTDKTNATNAPDSVIPAVNQKAIKSISLTKSKKEMSAKVKSSLMASRENLVKLNSKAWAVQMGSFKNKENARVLADRLRAAGFKAFTKDIKSAKGSLQTRVYIGPEFKQASAVQLNADVQHTLNMQGIVIAYKPLAL